MQAVFPLAAALPSHRPQRGGFAGPGGNRQNEDGSWTFYPAGTAGNASSVLDLTVGPNGSNETNYSGSTSATGGGGGSVYGNSSATKGGDATASTILQVGFGASTTAITADARADGGAGGYCEDPSFDGSYPGIAADGGTAHANAYSDSDGGNSTAGATATGGQGGDNGGADGSNGTNAGPGGTGGEASADATALSNTGNASAQASAYGGLGGTSANTSVNNNGLDGGATATAKAISSFGWANAGALANTGPTARASAYAMANGNISSTASANATSGSNSSLTTVSNSGGGTVEASATASGGISVGSMTNGVGTMGGAFVQTGGIATFNQALAISSTGSYSISGGTLSTPSISNNGTFSYSGGVIAPTSGVTALSNSGYVHLDADGGASLSVAGAGSTSITSITATQHVNSISLTGGAVATVAAGGGKHVVAKSVSVDSSSKLDLNDNKMIVDYDSTSPFNDIKAALASGFNGAAWNGNGISSSAAAAQAISTPDHRTSIGYGEASALFSTFPATFAGESVDSTSILLRYVYAGDANLDGTVDTLDSGIMSANWAHTGTVWTQADFNFDGTTDTLDFNILTSNFGWSVSSRPAGEAGVALVPEPGALGLLLGVGVFLGTGRRRRTGA